MDKSKSLSRRNVSSNKPKVQSRKVNKVKTHQSRATSDGRQSARKAARSLTESQLEASRSSKESFIVGHVREQVAATWPSLDKATQPFVVKCIESSISHVLSKSVGLNYGEVQEVMEDLKRKILKNLQRCRAPKNKLGDYKQLHAVLETLNSKLAVTKEELKSLKETEENALQKQDKIDEALEMHAAMYNTKTHRFLSEDSDMDFDLEIPYFSF